MPRVRESIKNEMSKADDYFSDLPDDAWRLPVQEEGWRDVEKRVEAFAGENDRVYRFVNGLDEFAWRERDVPGAKPREPGRKRQKR